MGALQALLDILQVKACGDRQFIGNPGPGSFRIYGGLTVTQALDAVRQCCPREFVVQSLHGQFLRPGDHQHTIDIVVEDLKDGRRFKLYNVYCKQQGKTIFFATVTFHLPTPGFEHTLPAPPLLLPADDKAMFFSHRGESFNRAELAANSAALEVRIDDKTAFDREQSPTQQTWFKSTETPALNDWQQTLLLAYASDWNMPSVAMRPHIVAADQYPNIASLDHSIWFYRQADLQQWTVYVQESPAALNGRGHTRGLFYNQQGALLACVNQESFLTTLAKTD